MKKVILFAAVLVFIIACGSGNSSSVSSEEIAAGEKTYKSLCVACHGADGEMALNGAKKFSASTMTVDERILVITNGKNMMTPYKGILSESEIKSVAAYTVELSKAKK